MTQWSPFDNHIQVGIDWDISPANPTHSDTSVRVTWKYYIQTDGYSFNDDETLHEDCTNWGGRADSFHNGSSGGVVHVGSHTETYGISSNSGTVHASCNLTGVWNGATPSKSVDVNLPNRPDAPIDTPSAGENVQVSNITSDGATITWSPPTSNGGDAVDNYEYQISQSSGFPNPVDGTTGSGDVRTYTFTNFMANTTYYTRVRAHNSAGWGAWTSATASSFTTLGTGPDTPGTPQLTSRSQTSISIGWSAASSNGGGTVTYFAELSSDPNFTTITSTYTGTLTSCSFSGLTPGTVYYFQVQSQNSKGSSAFSTSNSGATLPSLVYNDSGDFVSHLNNLAGAVADKFIHLGTFAARGRTSMANLANGVTWQDPQTQIETCTQPDPPLYTGGSTDTFVIQYPGTYFIEFAQGITGGWGQPLEMGISVNGSLSQSTLSVKGGSDAVFGDVTNAHNTGVVLTTVRKLDVGDTVGFRVNQTTGTSKGVNTLGGGDLTMKCRITMIGF